MNELLWTVVGFALATVALRPWRRRVAVATPPAAPPPTMTATPPPAPLASDQHEAARELRVQAVVPPDAQRMAMSLADELASLVSGVEGRAHHLIEAAPTRTQLPDAAEAMLASVTRLRRLHGKLVAFGRGRAQQSGTTDVRELLAGLADELPQMQLGLELHWDPPSSLPLLAAHPDAVRDALLFLASALLRAERGATRLSFVVERSFATEVPSVQLEMMLEWVTDPHRSAGEVLADSLFTLDLEAANHLITTYGGELTLTHLPGRSARAVVRLPMAVAADFAAPAGAAVDSRTADDTERHDYGGALVLESDPSLRAVLARELKASGRAVFTCADGASAHTFLQATPDRFELLIVDDPHQLEDGASLAEAIRTHAPTLKICLVTQRPAAPSEAWPRLFWLQKPFGVQELRRKLATILTAG
ncbi:MAG: response regulator [Planctomycetes bacterium]|nr:response regulator [Planctomycetota bacterium]